MGLKIAVRIGDDSLCKLFTFFFGCKASFLEVRAGMRAWSNGVEGGRGS